MHYNLITFLKERRPVSEVNLRWRSVSIGLRRILSLFVDTGIFIYFMGEASKAADSGDYLWLVLLNLFVILHFSATPLSMGKLVTGLRVLSTDISMQRYFRNMLVSTTFLFHCCGEAGIPLTGKMSGILFVLLLADKSLVLGFFRQTFMELLWIRTVVGPAGGSDEIPEYK